MHGLGMGQRPQSHGWHTKTLAWTKAPFAKASVVWMLNMQHVIGAAHVRARLTLVEMALSIRVLLKGIHVEVFSMSAPHDSEEKL